MTQRITIVLGVVVALVISASVMIPAAHAGQAARTNPAYLAQFPSADRVRSEVKGGDAMDTAARQMGAFWQLQEIVKELSGFRFVRGQLTPDERRVLGEYAAGYQSAGQPYASYPDRPKWYQMHAQYETDDAFRNELFARFLTPTLLAQYQQTKGDTRAQVAANRPAAAPPKPAEPPAALPKPPEGPATAVLTVTSGLRAAGGGNPLGGTSMLLMKQSFAEYLRQHGFEPTAGRSPLTVWASACATGSPACMAALRTAAEDVVATAQKADPTGTAILPAVPPGRYYLYAQAIDAGEPVVWDVPVDLKAGANSVTLDTRSITPLTEKQAQAKTSPGSGAASGGGSAARIPDPPPAPPRPSGPKNSSITLNAAVLETYYLLDDDFEAVLKRVGFQSQQILGEQLPLLNSFEVVKRWKAMSDNPAFKLLGGAGNVFDFDLDGQLALGMKALREHTVATAKTDAAGNGAFPTVPAGTYHVYGTSEQFVKTGARGTISGDTVTLSDTGINAVTIWNVRVGAKTGSNVVTLTRDNAAFDPFAK